MASHSAPHAVGGIADRQSSRLRLVLAGDVDNGKSTLIGRLLYDSGAFPDGRYEQLVAAATRRGTPFQFSSLTDALQVERDQNVTIDTAEIGFKAAGREYVFIDAPGHQQFLKHMITGAASADAAIVLLDAQQGVTEQSRRHGYLLKLLGIRQLAVAVNKLDLVGFAIEKFDRAVVDYSEVLANIGISAIKFVPIVASAGDNVARRSEQTPWYTGPTVLQLLEQFVAAEPAVALPLRFAIQAIYRFDERRIIAGRVESGTLNVGERLQFLPSGRQSTIKALEQWQAPVQQTATAGDAVGVTLTDNVFITRGEIACHLHDVPSTASKLLARLFWLGRQPLREGKTYKIKLCTQESDCDVVAIRRVIDTGCMEAVPAGRATVVEGSQVADVIIRTRRPIISDAYDRVPQTGRFVVMDGYDVCGGGIILEAYGDDESAICPGKGPESPGGKVSPQMRHARHGHKSAVLWFTGLSGAGKSTLAFALERALFDRGCEVCVLDGDYVRVGLSSDLGFSAGDRSENIRRAAEVASLMARTGVIVIAALISPLGRDRWRARQIIECGHPPVPFAETYLSAPLQVCEQRDPKRLYERARNYELKDVTGISAPFEPPQHPDLVIDTSAVAIPDAIATIMGQLQSSINLAGPGERS